MHVESLTVPGRLVATAAEVRAYEAAAEALVLAEAACAEHGCPLNERQRITFIASALQCFAGFAAELEDAEVAVGLLEALRPGERLVNGRRFYSAAWLGGDDA